MAFHRWPRHVSSHQAPPDYGDGTNEGEALVKQDVLFIHGWWAADWVWSRVKERFDAADYNTHTIDLPGPESERASFSDNLDWALEAARSIGNPILVGHSAGGLMAMKMAETIEPPACIAITPAAPAGVLPRPSPILIRFVLAALPSLLLGRDFFPRELLREIDLNLLDPAEQDETLEKMRPVSASQVRMILPALIGVDRRRLRAPLLVVGCAEDRLTPVAQTRAIARRYGAEYREYQNAAHYILREPAWSEMANDLVAWLNKAVPDEP